MEVTSAPKKLTHAIEFWGVEVVGRESAIVEVGKTQAIKITKAIVVGLKNDLVPVSVFLESGTQTLAICHLTKKSPHMTLNLVMNRPFKLRLNRGEVFVHVTGIKNHLNFVEDVTKETKAGKRTGPALKVLAYKVRKAKKLKAYKAKKAQKA